MSKSIDVKKIDTNKFPYLKFFPIPFLEDLINGQVIPFLGAGFSKNAKDGGHMPDWNYLGKLISEEMNDGYTYNNPLDAISAFEFEYGRTKLIEKLHKFLLTGEAQPGSTHLAFAKIPFKIVCTTNFDFLIEHAYSANKNYYCRPIIDEEHLAINNAKREEIILLKLHGDLHHPARLIATEDDYDSFMHRYPLISTYIASLLITKTCLFIGYSLDDPDLRQIWQLIKDRLGKLRRLAYAINIDTRAQNIAKYNRRHVKVINIPVSDSSQIPVVLEEVFEQLRTFLIEESVNNLGIDAAIKLQLMLEDNEVNYSRICYFSVPSELESFYRENIFPALEEKYFIPLIGDDLFQHDRDNFLTLKTIMIQKSAFVIVDMSSASTRSDYRMAMSKRKEEEIFVIAKKSKSENSYSLIQQLEPSEENETPIIVRPDEYQSIENAKMFSDLFLQVFDKRAKEKIEYIMNAPSDLHNKEQQANIQSWKQYSKSIIYTSTLIETILKNDLDKTYVKSELMSLGYLQRAKAKPLITEDQEKILIKGIDYRNEFMRQQVKTEEIKKFKPRQLSFELVGIFREILGKLKNGVARPENH